MAPGLRSVSYRTQYFLIFCLAFCFGFLYHPDSYQNSYCVEGLASPASRKITNSNKQQQTNKSDGGFAATKGFASKKQEGTPSTQEENDARAKQTVRNLFSVVSHIQNQELYQPDWSNHAAAASQDNSIIVATQDVPKGHPLTLFPIHALGLRTIQNDQRKKKKHQRDDTEFVAYDQDNDAAYFATTGDEQQAGMRLKLNIPLDNTQPASKPISDRKRHVLFSVFFPDKPIETGWLGGRIKSSSTTSNAKSGSSNCVTIPIPGAAPLCAIVATRDIQQGEELLQGNNVDAKVVDDCKAILAKDFEQELAELNGYITMACQ